MRRTTVLGLLAFMVLPYMLPALANTDKSKSVRSQAAQRRAPRLRAVPVIPTAKRAAGNRVFLEKADKLMKHEADSFMIVTGAVHFSKGPMQMYCDSAHYYPTNSSFDAFGNVRMEQGDTLFVYADELNFNGPEEIAFLYGYDPQRPVRLINRDVKLETDVFTYDLVAELGYYNTRGVLTDRRNRLVSYEGEYIPSTKDANFYGAVHLKTLDDKDTLDIYTDTLLYNTNTHEAEFYSPTTIVNANGVINSTDGRYNTVTGYSQLFDHSRVRTNRGSTLEGDTLYYDRNTGVGRAYGNMVLVDSAKQATLSGNYGYYDDRIDSAFVTGRALAMEYSQGDTLYMHGRYITMVQRIDTIRTAIEKPAADSTAAENTSADSTVAETTVAETTTTVAENVDVDSATVDKPLPEPEYTVAQDTTHILNVWPRVRFYRSDLAGLCDSMSFVQRDSNLYMYRHPIIWNQEQQVFGNIIIVHMNDSTVERADFPKFAFTAQKLEKDIYNQLSGKEMKAFFTDGKLRRLEVSGNVEAITFPEERDSTINKMIQVQSSFMTAWLKDNAIEKLKMWPATNGTATPMYLAKRSMLLLPKFEWYGDLRPMSPPDVFIIPKGMDELMEQPETE